jgi:murein L,D-transpeptidase YafK
MSHAPGDRTEVRRHGAVRLALRAVALAGIVALAGCQEEVDSLGYGPKHLRPVAAATEAKIRQLAMAPSSPILIRLYKEESEVEVWKQGRDGRFALLQTYPICKWSGKLGPKIKEGDRQAPEGFYTITPGLMNPNSSYHLAFNTGFPNAYDRAYGRTGTDLMVHGACSSRGCYAMTDRNIQDIYALARESFKGGQRSFQLQAFPFKMTPENLARHEGDPNMPFWMMLKEGSDHFEVTRQVPKVDVCGRKYVFDATPADPGARLEATRDCPILDVPQEITIAVASKRAKDEQETRRIVAELAAKRERDERRKAADLMIASALGARTKDAATAAPAGAPADVPAEGTPASAAEIMIASVPVPVAAPGRSPAATQVAAVQPQRDRGSGWFASMFSFTESSEPPATAPRPAADEPAAPALIESKPRVIATAPPMDQRSPAAPPASAPTPAAAESRVPAVGEAPPVDAGAPVALAPEPAPEPQKKSFLTRAFGSLFSTN